jgi:hypothetical protein
MTEATFSICKRVAEVQALLHDHIECEKHTAADVSPRRKRSYRKACCSWPCGRSDTFRRIRRRARI